MTAHIRMLLLAGLAAATVFVGPAAARSDDPLPRVEDALCPGIAGFDVPSALRMVDRFRANANALNRRLADPETCKPNVLVLVVDDGATELRTMNRRVPQLFADLDSAELRALLSQQGPAYVYSQVVTRTRDGQPVPDPDNLTDVPQASGWMAHSKIYTATREDIVHVLILLDRSAISDKTVGQIADYVTMRALTPTSLANSEIASDSILRLFDSPAGARPAALTAADHALLATLYEGIPNLPSRARLAELGAQAGRRANAE